MPQKETVVENEERFVEKSYAYITRGDEELLVFRGPEHEKFQVPKGTVEPDEEARAAVQREIVEETGLATFGRMRHLTTDIWTRNRQSRERYVRHFFHTNVYEPSDVWTHVVTGSGEERGTEFEFSWVPIPPSRDLALGADEYLELVAKTE